MPKYRKKPVVIEAEQTDKEIIIHTLEGDITKQQKEGEENEKDI